MHTFKDADKREWAVRIDVQAGREVKAALGFNLFSLVEDRCKGLAELIVDDMRLVDTLYVLCREQCRDRNVSDEDFGRLMYGDTIARAAHAFQEAYIDFFRDPAIRRNLKTLMSKATQAAEIVTAKLGKKLEEIDPETIANRLTETESADSASSAPESSGAIHPGGPSAICSSPQKPDNGPSGNAPA